MDRMTEALKVVAGDRLRGILSRLTSNRVVGAATGAGITAIIQSSSVTTVLVVGFTTSGLMTLGQAIGVILGANVGTTVTAQIIAFKVTKFALLPVAIGFAITFFGKQAHHRAWGKVILGLGLVFFGMAVMADAMDPLRDYQPFIDAMNGLKNPFLGILVGAGFTAVVQSSSATTGLVIVLAGAGLVELEAAVALVLGANIGTSVTAALAAIGKPRNAQRAALAHTLFNTLGVIIWLPFIGVLSNMVTSVGGGIEREIANAHTIFNLANTVIFIGFTNQLASLVTRALPDRKEETERLIRAKYIDKELLKTPPLALSRARLEVLRMAGRVRRMLVGILPGVLDGPGTALMKVRELDDEVDSLHGQIVRFLGQVSQTELGERDTDELIALMEATNNIEAIGDIIETNMVQLGFHRIDINFDMSDATRDVITDLHTLVLEAYDGAMEAITASDPDLAQTVSDMKPTITSQVQAASAHQATRLVADAPNRVDAYRLEIDLINSLNRIYYFTKRTARAVPAFDEVDVSAPH
ncbi:MAG: Na/Pi cotransporter family protein [bacterium]|nr:Na/Pi cotransporter family protein [bacterium]